MKKVFKIFGIAVFVALLAAVLVYNWLSMSMPNGEQGTKADELAQSMLSSLNYEGYSDLTEISWTFRNGNKHTWNKRERTVLVEFDECIVKLDFKGQQHEVLKENDEVDGDPVELAIAHFYNDSFWVVAPFKVMDKGVERRYVETDDGPGLLVTYTSGGVTPGDSYLWILDENYRPKYWRIWTSNVRIKGMKFKWKKWKQYNGVWLATSHPAQIPVNIRISDLEVE